MKPPSPLVKALQQALAREHAAVYGYAIVGAHLHGHERKQATDDLDAHRAERDKLEALLRAKGATPVEALASYTLPFRVDDRRTAHALAARLEQATLGGYVPLVGAAHGATRRTAVIAMRHAAVRQAAWSHTIDALPGLRT